jgi:hypothetical protein
MQDKPLVKQELIWKGLKIQLLQTESQSQLPDNRKSNVIARDSHGEVVWEAAAPTSYHDIYVDIRIDTVRNVLIAYSGNSYIYEIDLKDGAALKHYLVK